VKFGYYILNTYVPELDGDSTAVYTHWLEQFDAAESLGFDSLWVTEHHFRNFGGMMPSPSVILAAAAQRTKRMRLGAAVSIIPMHNPLRIAEEFAMVDQLSGGRLNFGAGRGMHPMEYTVFGYDWSNAQKRLPEALDIVTRAWSGGEFEWQGEHYRFPKLRVYPQPRQKPHPPIILGGETDYTLRRVVEYCDGWFPRPGRGYEIKEQLARLHRMAEEKGRDPKTLSTSVFRAPPDKATLREYDEAGIDRAVLEIPDESRDEILRVLDRYAPLLA